VTGRIRHRALDAVPRVRSLTRSVAAAHRQAIAAAAAATACTAAHAAADDAAADRTAPDCTAPDRTTAGGTTPGSAARAAAAAAPTGASQYKGRRRGPFLIEHVERRQTHVRHFFFAERELIGFGIRRQMTHSGHRRRAAGQRQQTGRTQHWHRLAFAFTFRHGQFLSGPDDRSFVTQVLSYASFANAGGTDQKILSASSHGAWGTSLSDLRRQRL
jgi:hypothetical protein